ncbi:hypothetical protein IMAU50019_01499 [Lactobacillus helveticus]|nr:hypothetical protein [Lactobacillus helveticus]NRN85874.1 hypothetical protein [Lactobacillus helveticus]NRO00680.1 hypothetical protein [Lactobacillus helveticus]NRO10975.1 hypothetical protein [Lactobacillus helveticus]NRO45464.1 hypothetical protein [Lactobacillus helveticus]
MLFLKKKIILVAFLAILGMSVFSTSPVLADSVDINDNAHSADQDTQTLNIPNDNEQTIPSSEFYESKAAPLVRIAPNPKGKWVKASTLKYKINPTKSLYTFAANAGSYLLINYVGKSKVSGAIASGISSVFSSKIKGRNNWVTVYREKKNGKYVLLSRQRMVFYRNKSRTKRVASTTITARFVKRTKFARRYRIPKSESPFSSVY